MRKKSIPSRSKSIQTALDSFPKIVADKKTSHAKRQGFIEKTFGTLARKVHQEVHGKKTRPTRRVRSPKS